jgi:hypothetical protein
LVDDGIIEEFKPKILAMKKSLEKRSKDIEKLSNEVLSGLDPEQQRIL